ncbi:GPN-loop GTPase 3-like protein [Wallemia ichthyophaga EXF-994]|uniref:GPN-loop GTPase 3 n=2 Tax=Wallemia ichthyophaga TaxID=245174 RepID=R9ARN3_WALI9|nr:GPN-loop GTPase 3-like protein [Wallemia ichthyophaga EXF-994]EOR04909.1 GPN-loop GTPase 3-like protein [Wallemia ichthyophaga EXF-994]
MHLFNLDPAAENFDVQPEIDIRDLISLEDVMDELSLGPNGALIYCFEYLMQNLDWLEEQIGTYEDDYLVIDCPGQIELYTHFPLMQMLVDSLHKLDVKVAATYLLEAQFMDDRSKFFAGVLSATSAMINLEVPHINVMTKMDLVGNEPESVISTGRKKKDLERYLDPDPTLILDEINRDTNPKFHSLNQAIVGLIEDHNLIQFIPLDVTDEDSIDNLLSHIDNSIQFGEDEEPNEPADLDEGDFGEEF